MAKKNKKKDTNPKIPGKQGPKSCPKGYFWSSDKNRCVKTTDPTPDAKGKDCPPGTYYAADVGRCVTATPKSVDCGPGKVWNDAKGKCVDTAETKHGCPKGFYWDAKVGACVQGEKPKPKPPVDCPAGTHWDGARCITDAADEGEDSDVPEDAPPMPTDPLPDGWTWVWNGTRWVPAEGEATKPTERPRDGYEWTQDEAGNWVQTQTKKYANDLFAQYKLTLESFGITGADDFLKQSVKEDWNESTFLIKMRESAFYLANPLFAANINNAKAGKTFLSEGQVIGFASEAKRLARSFGYQEPSDNYIAMGLQGGLSVAEFEHRFQVQQRINQFGAGVLTVYKALMGSDPSDQDLYEIFDKEISTKTFDDRARAAEMRGRPMVLGLGIRSAAEAAALDLLGVTADQAFAGYQKLANALPGIERLASIDQTIANDPNNPFDSFGALFQSIFQSDARSQDEILLMTAREQARFKQGGTPAGGQSGPTGLLSAAEKSSFG